MHLSNTLASSVSYFRKGYTITKHSQLQIYVFILFHQIRKYTNGVGIKIHLYEVIVNGTIMKKAKTFIMKLFALI